MGNPASKLKNRSGRKGLYEATDLVDEWLLNQVAKHVKNEEIRSLARDLGVKESVLSGTKAPKDQAYKVI